MTQGGKTYKTAVQDLNDGNSGTFQVPLSALLPLSGPITVEVYDEDWPDSDDLIVNMS